MDKLKIYQIVLDGIDKTGKDLIKGYIYHLGKAKYICNSRGIMSMIAYSKKFNRNYVYDIENERHTLNVLLDVKKDDWKVRCAITNEPYTDYEKDVILFDEAYKILVDADLPVSAFNTSKQTPYQIAKLILEHIENLNEV